jgi:hypothetical protein
MGKTSKEKTISIYMNSNADSTEKLSEHKQYKPSLICTHMIFIVVKINILL